MGYFDGDSSEANPVQGYLSTAILANTYVYPTGGTLNSSHTPVMQEFYENGSYPGLGVMSPALHAHGTDIDGGSIEFEYVPGTGSLFSLMSDAQRGFTFVVTAGTPTQALTLNTCFLESLTLQSSGNQLVTGSCSFKSIEEWQLAPSPTSLALPIQPLAYYQTGASQVIRWSVNMSYPLKPVFWNSATNTRPRYFRVGKTKATINVTTVGGLVKGDTIQIGTGTKVITGVVTEQSLKMATRSSVNEYNYTVVGVGNYTSVPPRGSGGPNVAILV